MCFLTYKNLIPKNALRGCIDWQSKEYFYIGRTRPQDINNKPEYLSEGIWTKFNETIPNRIGKVHMGDKCMYLGFNNLELKFRSFDVLCLRPSPAPLSVYVRSFLRHYLTNSNERISKLNANTIRLPEHLIQFVKYPSQLSSGITLTNM